MALPESWHLKSRAHLCSVTEQPFAEGEKIFTTLFQAADGSFERLDFSAEGWEKRQAADEPQPFSSWQTRYRPPETEARPQVVEKESAEDLIKRLIEEDHESTENVRYVLAIMLERQRLLRETDRQRTPTGILRVYEHRKTGDVMIIRDPDIPLDQVESVQMDVIAMLEPTEPAPDESEEPPTAEPESEQAEPEAAPDQPDTEQPDTDQPDPEPDPEPDTEPDPEREPTGD